MRIFILRFALIIVILTILALIVQGDLLSATPLVIAGQIAGILLILASRAAFKKQQFNVTAEPGSGSLIRRGPYRFLRHPMYAGALLFIWASILGHWSLLNGAIGMIVLIVSLWRISLEEQLLRTHYADYTSYAEQTKRIIPFIY
jgi:protein-S-isoprenylcysteine O-methyltransferase Ste14